MSLRGIFPIDQWTFDSQSVLATLSNNERERLFKNSVESTYKKGEVVFKEGHYPSGIFFIVQGKVKKYRIGTHSDEHIIYVANAGELFGYHAVLADERYPDSAAVLEESLLAFIPKEEFLDVVNSSLELCRKLLKVLSHEFAVMSNSLSVFAKRSVRERVAIALIVLREKFKTENSGDQPIIIDVSREDIANIAGTTRENVVRLFRELKDDGIIETKGRKIWVTDIRKLVAISNYQYPHREK